MESDDQIEGLEGFYSSQTESVRIIFWVCCCLLEGTPHPAHISGGTKTEAYWHDVLEDRFQSWKIRWEDKGRILQEWEAQRD